MAKETINKIKRQPTEQEKIFANNKTNKGLISEIQKQFIQLTIKKQQQQKFQKMGRRIEQTFFQIRYTDSQQVHEKVLNITNNQGNPS